MRYLKIIIFPVIGAVIGYAYYYYYGCTNGCPLTSQWYVTTIYGLLLGLTLAVPVKKKDNQEPKS